MPLEHSEDLNIQNQSVFLFNALKNEVNIDLKPLFDDFYSYAVQHMEVIKQFGRFPHRNEILNRKSTKIEVKFLKKGR